MAIRGLPLPKPTLFWYTYEVFPNLYIGGALKNVTAETIATTGITHVYNLTVSSSPAVHTDAVIFDFPIKSCFDCGDTGALALFLAIAKSVRDILSITGFRVLIHCDTGSNRSAIAAAVFISMYGARRSSPLEAAYSIMTLYPAVNLSPSAVDGLAFLHEIQMRHHGRPTTNGAKPFTVNTDCVCRGNYFERHDRPLPHYTGVRVSDLVHVPIDEVAAHFPTLFETVIKTHGRPASPKIPQTPGSL